MVEVVTQFKYLGSMLVNDGKLEVELAARKTKAVFRFRQFEKMWGTRHLSVATKMKCYRAYVLPILLFGSETWSLSQAQSLVLERVHTSCLRSILGVKLSDRHSNAHVRAKCGATTLSTIISTNRLRWLGHVGRMGHGRLPHIALFSSLYGVKKRPSRGRPRLRWEECVCADLRTIGISVEDWEAECQFRCAWRKRLWEFSHPGAEQQQQHNLRVSGRRGLQAAAQHADYHALPFSGMDQGNSLPYWEPPPNPTRLWLNLDASTPPMF
jgi:hypothetical protein